MTTGELIESLESDVAKLCAEVERLKRERDQYRECLKDNVTDLEGCIRELRKHNEYQIVQTPRKWLEETVEEIKEVIEGS